MGRYVIMDIGDSYEVKKLSTGEVTRLSRYGVWDTYCSKSKVIDQGDNLEELLVKYKVKREDVVVRRPNWER